jgi:drug/metabolite transporter (DMT)-like permease
MKKTLGIVLLIVGVLMIAYTGFNFVTNEKVVELGSIEITKEKNHVFQWSPVAGVVLIIGGVVLLVMDKKSRV